MDRQGTRRLVFINSMVRGTEGFLEGTYEGFEAKLRQQVLPAVTEIAHAGRENLAATWAGDVRRAADDVARHGLRVCALPGCGATEPQPKTFKVCGRCRRVCYCSAAHQTQDWRRHKRADTCATAPQ
jgi:hypothetical protein